jgi:hypothetical protein
MHRYTPGVKINQKKLPRSRKIFFREVKTHQLLNCLPKLVNQLTGVQKSAGKLQLPLSQGVPIYVECDTSKNRVVEKVAGIGSGITAGKYIFL